MLDKNIEAQLDSAIELLMNLEMDIAKDFRGKLDVDITASDKLIHGELFNSISMAIGYLHATKYKIEQVKGGK